MTHKVLTKRNLLLIVICITISGENKKTNPNTLKFLYIIYYLQKLFFEKKLFIFVFFCPKRCVKTVFSGNLNEFCGIVAEFMCGKLIRGLY